MDQMPRTTDIACDAGSLKEPGYEPPPTVAVPSDGIASVRHHIPSDLARSVEAHDRVVSRWASQQTAGPSGGR